MKYKIYLDNCCFNRPYDTQSQETIRLETEAKLFIQKKIKENEIDLIWSFLLSFENAENPHEERRNLIFEWRSLSSLTIFSKDFNIEIAREIAFLGFDPKDSLHIACAVISHADFFITTDYQILRKGITVKQIKIIDPIQFVAILEGKT